MRALAKVTVLAPADEVEARQAIAAMVSVDGPVYIQMTREPSPVLFGPDYRLEIGRAVTLRQGGDVTVMSTGVQTARVFEAAGILAGRGIDATVLHLPTIKPLDVDGIVETARASGFVVVVEEQTVLGGLGEAVSEVLSDRSPVFVKRLGIKDIYGESGPNDLLLEKYRLSVATVAQDIESLLRERA